MRGPPPASRDCSSRLRQLASPAGARAANIEGGSHEPNRLGRANAVRIETQLAIRMKEALWLVSRAQIAEDLEADPVYAAGPIGANGYDCPETRSFETEGRSQVSRIFCVCPPSFLFIAQFRLLKTGDASLRRTR